MYKAKDSIVKQTVREILFNEVTSHLSGCERFNGLTLPNENIWLENSLINHFGAGSRVKCYERDEGVYKRLASNICNTHMRGKIWAVSGDIFSEDFEGARIPNFVWLDLCNSYSDKIIRKIADFATRYSKVSPERCVFALTMNRRRGHKSEALYTNKYYPHYKTKGIVQHLSSILRIDKGEVKKVDYMCEDLDVRAALMQLFIFKINKQHA